MAIGGSADNHPDEDALLEFSAGTLGVAARDAMLGHIDGCPRCRQALAHLARLSQATGSDGADDAKTRTGVDLLVGEMLGEYRVLERLSQGGMGVLYRGEQPVIGKPVAIKVLLPEAAANPELGHRLLAEARAVNAIRHPNIVDIFALGELDDGRPYVVMELLDGCSLAELLQHRGRLSPENVAVVLTQAMGALEAAHGAGVVHRDLKPDNIFVDARPEGWRVTLLDFGLAKQRGSNHLTAPNLVLGTPGYMAPEQIFGKAITGATDVYAMGIVAWTLLMGREPFVGGSLVEVMKQHIESPVPLLRKVLPDAPAALEALIARMLAKDPAARPSPAEVRRLLLTARPVEVTTRLDLGPVPSKATQAITGPGHPPVPDSALETQRVAPWVPITEADRTVPRSGPRWGVALLVAGLVFIAGAAAWRLRTEPPPTPTVETPAPAPAPAPAPTPPPPVAAAPAAPAPVPAPAPAPKPRGPARAEVEQALASARVRADALSHAPTRRLVLLQLDRLDDRLKKNESPLAISHDLDKLRRAYDLP